MRIAVIGTGYVGLVSGACFSEFGVSVTCVDTDAAKIARLRRGEMPIYEPGLEALVAANTAAGRLAFTTELLPAIEGTDAVFIAVGTPSRRGDGHADLSYVFAAAAEIGRALAEARTGGYTVVVTKSTVPVGTGREVAAILRRVCPSGDFDVASNPEFLREGSAIEDFMRPDRVVIGADDDRAREVMRQLYRPLYLSETPMLFTDIETAESAASFCMPGRVLAARAFPRTARPWCAPPVRPPRIWRSSRRWCRSTRRARPAWPTRSSLPAAARSPARQSPSSASLSSPTPTTCATVPASPSCRASPRPARRSAPSTRPGSTRPET